MLPDVPDAFNEPDIVENLSLLEHSNILHGPDGPGFMWNASLPHGGFARLDWDNARLGRQDGLLIRYDVDSFLLTSSKVCFNKDLEIFPCPRIQGSITKSNYLPRLINGEHVELRTGFRVLG